MNRYKYTGKIRRILLAAVCWIGMVNASYSQMDTSHRRYSFAHSYFKNDDGNVILYFIKINGCKANTYDSISFPDPRRQDVVLEKDRNRPSSTNKPIPLIKLHGNIAYSFDYRSQVDTPFAGSNLQMHNEQVYADATLKGKYPFRVIVNSRQSNSPYFRNYTDMNVEFKHQAYQKSIKDVMIADMIKKVNAADSINKYEQQANSQRAKYLALENWASDPARKQDIVQEKEKLYKQAIQLAEKESGFKMPPYSLPASKDSLNAIGKQKDSLLALMKKPGSTENKIQSDKKTIDSLYTAMKSTEHQIDSIRRQKDSTINAYANSVRKATSAGELEELAKKAGTNSMSGSDKALLSLTRFGIGRSMVNYSELTVNNISINGVNAEYNPSWYTAFAVGSVDYLFRDFVVSPPVAPKQNLVLGRFGWGDKEKSIFIFTVYTGTKNTFNSNSSGAGSTNPTSTPVPGSMAIFGYSFEAKYKLAKNAAFSFEAAKSSSPYVPGTTRSKSFDQAFAFADHNNEAFTSRFDINLPATHSALNVFYKEIGANFQSFSIYNSSTRQEGWGIKLRQSLFKDQLSISLQVKKNAFDDPLLNASYSSSMLFKSVQLVYRRKKWPIFSAGYMPSTQLLKSSSGVLSESVYYALTASMFYSYSYRHLRMNSGLMFSRFYNQGTDSGFVLYNARNILYTHQINWGKVNTQTDVQYTTQPGLTYWMFQQRLDISICKTLSIGGGLKNDLLPGTGTTYWGNSAQMKLQFKKIGMLQFQYSKDYLPNGVNGLMPYNWGRINWVKVF